MFLSRLGLCLVILTSLPLPLAAPSHTIATSNALERLPRQTLEGRTFRQYARVERNDGTYRLMFLDEVSFKDVARLGNIPDRATVVMETYYTQGKESTNFIKTRIGGRWLYGSFSPSSPKLTTRPDPSCQNCHNTARREHAGTFTLPLLRAAVNDGQVKTLNCERGGRTPCPAATYEQYR
jgi:hypothetical protein